MNIRLGEISKLELKNTTFDGFILSLMLTKKAGQTISSIDLDKINVKGVLTRKGKTFTTFNETVLDMLRCHASEARAINVIAANSLPSEKISDSIICVPIPMPVGGIMHLKGRDTFELEVDVDMELCDSSKCEILSSYIQVEHNEAMGYEYATPYTKSYICPNGVGQFEKHLGDMVQKVVFLDGAITPSQKFDKSVRSLEDIKLKSDKLNFSDKPYETYCRQFTRTDISSLEYKGDLVIFSNADQPLNEVLIEFDLNASNINNGEQKLIYSYLYSDPRLLAKAAAQESIHAIENSERSGVVVSPDVAESKKALEKVKKANLTDKEV